MRLAYADPVYLGMASRYPEHPSSVVWDSVEAHALLLRDLDEGFDGWAYSLSSTTLTQILPHAPACRVAAWVKPFCAFKRNVRIAYSWEPVLFKPARDSSKLGAAVGRDFLAENIALRKGLIGAKPARFNAWVLNLLGYVEGDEVVDMFPGTGSMGHAVEAGVVDRGGARMKPAGGERE